MFNGIEKISFDLVFARSPIQKRDYCSKCLCEGVCVPIGRHEIGGVSKIFRSLEDLTVLDDVGVRVYHVDFEAESLQQQVLIRDQHLSSLNVLLPPAKHKYLALQSSQSYKSSGIFLFCVHCTKRKMP